MSAQSMIQAFVAGEQLRRQQEQLDRQAQMDDLTRQIAKHREKREDWQFKADTLTKKFLELQSTPTALQAPENFEGGQGPLGPRQEWDPTAIGPSLREMPLKPLTLPADAELGIPEMRLQPQRKEDVDAASIAKMIQDKILADRYSTHVYPPGSTVQPAGGEMFTVPPTQPAQRPIAIETVDPATSKTVTRFVIPTEGATFPKPDKPAPVLGGMDALYAQSDPTAIGEAIMRGEREPDTGNLGRPIAAAVDSYLAKKGFNKAFALREWKAQIRLNATMNGSQQVRLDESIRSGLAMYDVIDALAAQWAGKGWGPLSQANMAAARNGAYGQEAQNAALQLTGAIGQLTSDVATIEQGGLTPTNESRAVAEKSLQDWWGTGGIQSMTRQGRLMMQIRHLARQTQETMTPGNSPSTEPAKPAMPSEAAPSGERVRVKGPNGETGTVPKGTPLGPGWLIVR